jgi:hypothetical protein
MDEKMGSCRVAASITDVNRPMFSCGLFCSISSLQVLPQMGKPNFCTHRRDSIANLLSDFPPEEFVVVRKALQGGELANRHAPLSIRVARVFPTIGGDAHGNLRVVPRVVVTAAVGRWNIVIWGAARDAA